jgi:hypothetical protein
MATDKSNKDTLPEFISDIFAQRSLKEITRSDKYGKKSGLVRDPQKLFEMYLKYRGCLHLGIDPTVNLSAGSLTKIFKDNGYPVMEKPYPKDDDWEMFIRFWQPEKSDNPLEDGLFSDEINLRTRLWKIDSATKKKKVAIFCKCNTHENFPDDNSVVRLPFIFFVLPKNIGLAVMFFYKPNSFYIMKDIPLEAQKPKYLFKQKLEPDFIFDGSLLNNGFITCKNTRYLDIKDTLESIFRIETGINGRGRYSINYLIHSNFITPDEASKYIKKELFRVI